MKAFYEGRMKAQTVVAVSAGDLLLKGLSLLRRSVACCTFKRFISKITSVTSVKEFDELMQQLKKIVETAGHSLDR